MRIRPTRKRNTCDRDDLSDDEAPSKVPRVSPADAPGASVTNWFKSFLGLAGPVPAPAASPLPREEERACLSTAMDHVGTRFPDPIVMSEAQSDLVSDIVRRASAGSTDVVFLSGGAGAGKTHLLRAIGAVCGLLDVEVLAVALKRSAANDINGVTLYRAFSTANPGAGLKLHAPGDFTARLLLVDDAFSISRGTLEHMAACLRRWTDDERPFGNCMVVLAGDLLGISSPVGDCAEPIWGTKLWLDSARIAEAPQDHRRTDAEQTEFLENVEKLRWGDAACLPYFRRFVVTRDAFLEKWSDAPYLAPVNDHVNRYNAMQLAKLPAPEFVSERSETNSGGSEGGFAVSRQAAENALPRGVRLGRGVVVLVTHNDFRSDEYRSGDTGVVEEVRQSPVDGEGHVVVVTIARTGETICVGRVSVLFHEYKQGRKVLGTMRGYPFKYGWATTIHRVADRFLDRAVVNPDGVFGNGLMYAAVSRVRRPGGLCLVLPICKSHIRVDRRAVAEYKRLLKQAE